MYKKHIVLSNFFKNKIEHRMLSYMNINFEVTLEQNEKPSNDILLLYLHRKIGKDDTK